MIIEEYKTNKQNIEHVEELRAQLLEAQKEIHHKLRILCRDSWKFYKDNLPKDFVIRIRNWNDSETTYTAKELKKFDVFIYGLNTSDPSEESEVGVGDENVNFQVYTAPFTNGDFVQRYMLRVSIPKEKFESDKFELEDIHLGY